MALIDIPTNQLASALSDGEEASSAELLALVQSKDVSIRESLAAREDAPMGAFIHLAQDKKSSVRVALASNPSIADKTSVISILSADKDQDVLIALVNNMAIPALRVRILLDSNKKKVRQAVEARLLER